MKKLNIFIVDDEENTCKAISRILSIEKHKVSYEINPKIALSQIQNNKKVDLLITDIQMPEVNGIEIIEELRKLKPNLPIIAISAHFNKDILDSLSDSYRIEFIEKPFGGLELLQHVDKYVF